MKITTPKPTKYKIVGADGKSRLIGKLQFDSKAEANDERKGLVARLALAMALANKEGNMQTVQKCVSKITELYLDCKVVEIDA